MAGLMNDSGRQPSFTVHDKGNRFAIYSIFRGQTHLSHSLFGKVLSNLSSQRLSQDMAIASIAASFPLLGTVRLILSICTKKKVLRADASGIIALMADKQVLWNWSDIEFIRETMRQDTSIAALKKAIVMAITTSKPFPTTVSTPNFFPESFSGGTNGEIVSYTTDAIMPVNVPIADFGELAATAGTRTVSMKMHGEPPTKVRYVMAPAVYTSAGPLTTSYFSIGGAPSSSE